MPIAGVRLAELRRLVESPDVVAVLQHILHAVCALADADGTALLLYDRESEHFEPIVSHVVIGVDEHWPQLHLTGIRTLFQRAVETRDIVEVPDTNMVSDGDDPLLAGGRRPGAVAVAPVTIEGTVVGVLEVYHAQPRAAALPGGALRPGAELAGLALTVAHTHGREHALLRRLEALDAASAALLSERSSTEILQRIVEVATQMAGAQYGALGIAGPDGYLTDFITTGLNAQERAQIGRLPSGQGLLGVLIH